MLQRALTVGTILLVGVLHLPAVLFDWYFYFWWYDVVMHTLGGIAMGFLAYTLWHALQERESFAWRRVVVQMIFILGFVALVGIAWEWSEALSDALTSGEGGMARAQLGLTDTMLDLYFDLFGGFVAWLGMRIQFAKKENT